MAKLIPTLIDKTIANSEITFLNALSKYTPDNWVVYHNFNFLELNRLGGPKQSNTLQQGEADVVLFIPEQGFLVIEVKGGGIEYVNNQWFTIDRYGDKHIIKNPFDQARKAQHFIARTCQTITSEKFINGYAVCFPDIKIDINVGLPAEAPPQVVLTSKSLVEKQLEKTILSLFSHWKHTTTLSSKASKLIQQEVLQPSFRLLPQLSQRHESDKEKLLQLTQQQYQTLDFINGHQHALIEGGAGTGKTLLLIEKARRLAEDGKKILILTFNIRLAEVISQNFKNNNLIDVSTIHHLSEQLCKKSGIAYQIPSDPKKISDFFNNTSVELLSEAAIKLDISYDGILVDEAQDFEDNWWIVIMELLVSESPEKSWLYIFYDHHQNIFDKDINFPIDKHFLFKLTHNCRNTSQISQWLNNHFSYSATTNPMAPEGEAVEVIRWKNTDEQNIKLVEVINKLKRNNVDLDDVVVLTAFKPENSNLEVPDDIEFTNIMKYKGLEKSVVILGDVQPDKNFSLKENLIYTAATRAISKLIILIKKGALPSYLD
jgi:thymidine kinase